MQNKHGVPTRIPGVDLLKLLAMLMVVVLHLMGHGGILNELHRAADGPSSFVWMYFYSIAICAVDLFGLISGYLLVGSSGKTRRIVSLYCHVAFYTILITVLFAIFAPARIRPSDYIWALIAVFGSYWYISAYACVLLTLPLWNAFLRDCDLLENPYRVLMCLAVMLLGVILIKTGRDPFMFHSGYSCTWLVVLYLLGGLLRVNADIIRTIRSRIGFKRLAGCYFLVVLIPAVSLFFLPKSISVFLYTYTSPGVLLCAVILFEMLCETKISFVPINRLLTTLAPCALGVYLIHDHPLIRSCLRGQLASVAGKHTLLSILEVSGLAVGIFIGGLSVDFLRGQLFQLLRIQSLGIQLETWSETLIDTMTKKVRAPDNMSKNQRT